MQFSIAHRERGDAQLVADLLKDAATEKTPRLVASRDLNQTERESLSNYFGVSTKVFVDTGESTVNTEMISLRKKQKKALPEPATPSLTF